MIGGSRTAKGDWLRAGRSGDQIPMGRRFFTPIQTGPGTHPASCTWVPVLFPGGEAALTTHPCVAPG